MAQPLSFLDALFTATSAQCVTGLVVVDTGTRLTLFGQLVVLVLIQVGGLGITTFSVYLFFYLRLGVGTRGRWIIQETLLHTPVDSLQRPDSRHLRHDPGHRGRRGGAPRLRLRPRSGLGQGLYSAIFHSVSAFCNAGFALFPDSLVGYRDNPLVNLTIMVLIVLGGIGFLVIREVLDLLKPAPRRRRLSLHSQLVFWTTGILIFGGALLIGLLEIPRPSPTWAQSGEGIWIALFQSVTARTAGFNTIDLNLFEVPTLLSDDVPDVRRRLARLGRRRHQDHQPGPVRRHSAQPAQGLPHTNVFRRTIPDEVVTKTLTLVMLAALLRGRRHLAAAGGAATRGSPSARAAGSLWTTPSRRFPPSPPSVSPWGRPPTAPRPAN